MSGGSYDYIWIKIDDIEIRNTGNNPKRNKFQKLLKLVADAMHAMHAIEWVDSGDYGEGAENEYIDKVFDFMMKMLKMNILIKYLIL